MMPKNQAIKLALLYGQCPKSGQQILPLQFTDVVDATAVVLFFRSFSSEHLVAKGKIAGFQEIRRVLLLFSIPLLHCGTTCAIGGKEERTGETSVQGKRLTNFSRSDMSTINPISGLEEIAPCTRTQHSSNDCRQ